MDTGLFVPFVPLPTMPQGTSMYTYIGVWATEQSRGERITGLLGREEQEF